MNLKTIAVVFLIGLSISVTIMILYYLVNKFFDWLWYS